MKKLCTKWFKKWAKKMNLKSNHLIEAVENLEERLSVVDLGGNLFKIRVKRAGQGKSSGFRTIIAYKKKIRRFFYMDLEKMKGRI